MKNFKELMVENAKTAEIVDALVLEGKQKVIKVVKDSNGKFKKKKTFTCTGDNEKFNSSKGKCEHISGSEKMNKMKGAKKRNRTLKKKPDSVKQKDAKKREKANARFGLGK